MPPKNALKCIYQPSYVAMLNLTRSLYSAVAPVVVGKEPLILSKGPVDFPVV